MKYTCALHVASMIIRKCLLILGASIEVGLAERCMMLYILDAVWFAWRVLDRFILLQSLKT